MTSPREIHIKGNGLPAAMAAAYLGRMLPSHSYKISCFSDAKSLKSEGALALFHSDLREFNRLLKIKEVDFVKYCDGVFSLGDHFTDEKGHDYINTFCPYGLSINGVSFMAALQKSGAVGQLSDWEDCNLPARMAREGKFLPPDSQGRPVIGDYSYGYQINPVKYRELLLQQAQGFGVSVQPPSAFERVSKDSAFLTLECELPDFKGEFSETQDSGRTNHIRHHVSERNLKTIFNLQNTKYEMTVSADDYVPPKPSIRNKIWVDDTLSFSKIPNFLPFLGDSSRLIQIALERLIRLFPAGNDLKAERSEYNRVMSGTFSRFSDFQSIVLASSGFEAQRLDELSEEAQFKLQLFSARGRLSVLDDDTLFQDHWVSMLLGQGYWPRALNLMSKNLSDDEIKSFRDNYNQIVEKALSQMPRTSDFIEKTCPSPTPSNHFGNL